MTSPSPKPRKKAAAAKTEPAPLPQGPDVSVALDTLRMRDISTTAGAEAIAARLSVLRELEAKIGETFDPIVDAAHKTKRAAEETWKTAKFKRFEYLNPVSSAKSHLFQIAQRWKAAEDERRRLAAEAAKPKLEAEAVERSEQLEKDLVEQGLDKETAAGIAESEKRAEEPKVEDTKVEGLTFQKSWRGRVTNVRAACLSIANGAAPMDCIEFRRSALNSMARTHTSTKTIPGFAFEQETKSIDRR